MNAKKGSIIVISLLIVIIIIPMIYWVKTSDNLGSNSQPGDHHPKGGFELIGFSMGSSPAPFYFTEDGDPVINESLEKEFLNCTFDLILTINNTDYQYRRIYSYKSGYEQLRPNSDLNSDSEPFTNWSYNIHYTFSIKFIPQTENETIHNFSIFSSQRYLYGGFKISDPPKTSFVEWYNISGNLIRESSKSPDWAYYGTVEDAREGNIYAMRVWFGEYGTYYD